MIMGIGVDLVRVERIEKSLKNPRFLEKCFSEEERRELARKGAQSAAACFAAKEAFAKATGWGLFEFALCEVSLLHRKNGSPYLAFSGAVAQRLEGAAYKFHVSVSHDGGFSQCFVVLEAPFQNS